MTAPRKPTPDRNPTPTEPQDAPETDQGETVVSDAAPDAPTLEERVATLEARFAMLEAGLLGPDSPHAAHHIRLSESGY